MDPFGALARLSTPLVPVTYFRLEALERQGLLRLDRLPVSLRVLLECVLRAASGPRVSPEDVATLAAWSPKAGRRPGGPFFPAPDALLRNAELEFSRNRERYQFLRWAQEAFDHLRIVPPATGIVHQVNLEYLATVVARRQGPEGLQAFPDSLVGTDSHTTMVNGLGVLGWGGGGIEAEAVMLGEPLVMIAPEVVGFRLRGRLREGATATDLTLTITQILRQHGVVVKFVEFTGVGLQEITLPDRATVAHMAPEYGATAAFFPVDDETLRYLRQTGREPAPIAL